ncbi:hypothetical protein L9F63_014764, partial [Diploptera punctata]
VTLTELTCSNTQHGWYCTGQVYSRIKQLEITLIAMNTLVLTTIIVCLAQTHAQNYCSLCRNHTMCLYPGTGPACSRRMYWGVKNETKQEIVDIHNRYRQKVANGQEKRGAPGPQPAAADMSKLVIGYELATIAQRWADQCTFQHDLCRRVDRFGWVGQNLYMSGRWQSNGVHPQANQNWEEAIAAFYNEVAYLNNKNIDSFSSYPPKNGKEVGHYTQLVWGATYRVGCGYSAFVDTKDGKDWFRQYYVCDYGPGGNVVGRRIYVPGKACSSCPRNSTCKDGLCEVSPSSFSSSRAPRTSRFPFWFNFPSRWFYI